MESLPDKFTAFKAQALEDCLEQIESGRSMEEALQSYGALAAELRPLLEIALANRAYASQLDPGKAAMARSRARFLAAAHTKADPSSKKRLAGLMLSRLALAAFAFFLVFLLVSGSTVAASAQALPGDLLYPVKLAAERTRLWLTADPLERLKLEQTFDQRRLEEIFKLKQANRSGVIRLAGEVLSIQPGVWNVRGIQVLVTSATQFDQTIEVGFYVEVTGQLQSDGAVLAESIRTRQIEFSGWVEAVNDQSWVVDGLTIKVTGRTQWIGNPGIQDRVKVGAFVLADGSLQAFYIQALGSNEPAATWTSTVTASPTSTPTLTPTQIVPILQPTKTQKVEVTKTPEATEEEDDDDRDADDEEKKDDDSDKSGSSGKSPTNTPKPEETKESDDDRSSHD